VTGTGRQVTVDRGRSQDWYIPPDEERKGGCSRKGSQVRHAPPGDARTTHSRPPSTVHRLLALTATIVLIAIATPLSATLVTSAITGRVTSSDAPAAGVTVAASSKALLGPRSTTTSARGTYWLGSLPPGEYDITFSRSGLTTLTRRAVVELGRVARADAVLDPSEEGDTVTSTAKTISVAGTTEITTHFSDAMLDRLPILRDPRAAQSIGPAFLESPGSASIDDVQLEHPELLGEEVIEQVTVIRAGVPADSEDDRGAVLAAVTRTGGDAFSVTVRDTISSFRWHGDSLGGAPRGILHLFESAAGGRIVRDRLWFFAAGWSGDSADRPVTDLRGFAMKLSVQPAAAHNVEAEILDGDSSGGLGASMLALRYTATPAERATLDFLLARSDGTEIASARATVRMGEHLLSVGGTGRSEDRESLTATESDALYVTDRWSSLQWTLKAGLRRERGRDGSDTLPRFAATFDPGGDGRRAIVATYGQYALDPERPIRIATIGYAAAIGSSGSARIDAVHREDFLATVNEVQIDARYRLFDRFEAGANYGAIAFLGGDVINHVAAGWISAEFPLGDRQLGATILQRWSDSTLPPFGRRRVWPVDAALRFSFPLSRFGLTVAADGINLFDSDRAARAWIRVRL